MKVKLIDNISKEFEFSLNYLKKDNTYVVFTIQSHSYRLINEMGEPTLYPISCFEIIDPQIPNFWNAYYSSECNTMDFSPQDWSTDNFWNNYFDYKSPTVEKFWKDCRELYDIKYFVLPYKKYLSKENGIELTCISKHAYLRETKKKMYLN